MVVILTDWSFYCRHFKFLFFFFLHSQCSQIVFVCCFKFNFLLCVFSPVFNGCTASFRNDTRLQASRCWVLPPQPLLKALGVLHPDQLAEKVMGPFHISPFLFLLLLLFFFSLFIFVTGSYYKNLILKLSAMLFVHIAHSQQTVSSVV